MRTGIRVLVVEDHQMVAEAVAAALDAEPDIAVVGVVGTAALALERSRALTPDVVVLDYGLPDGMGTAVATQIRAERPATRVVLVTGVDDSVGLVGEAIAAGCAGIVVKHRGLRDLVAAIRTAHAGASAVSPGQLRTLVLRLASGATGSFPHGLTVREVEILQLLVDGLSNRAIADHLDITLHTVRNHVQAVIRKIGAHSKLEAVATALREGIVLLPRNRGVEFAAD